MPSATVSRRTALISDTDPVCGTCRKKSRKCDRTRPTCMRCRNHGLVCEGYQLNIQMYDMKNGALRKTRSNAKVDHETRDSVKDATKSMLTPSTTNSPGSSHTNSSTGMNQQPNVNQEQELLLYYQNTVCATLWITCQETPNPFEFFLLPLAHQHPGLLNAILGLAACHIAKPGTQPKHPLFTAAIQYRLEAIQSLKELLLKEESHGLSELEEEAAMAIVLVSVLHDLYDCGISPHGAHLNGVTFLCERLIHRYRNMTSNKLFLITMLTWFDLSRGFSGAEKLAFPPSIRDFVASTAASTLNSVVGCPAEVFVAIGAMLSAGKKFARKEMDADEFRMILDPILAQLRACDPTKGHYPNRDVEWVLLAEAYRHMAIIRVLRFPDTCKIPCTDDRIKASVAAILDVSATIPRQSPFFKRLLFPLFVAGADTNSPHQQQYALMCLENIKITTGISYRRSVFMMLEQTWEDRQKSDGTTNVPWFNYTCSNQLARQHDYLFF
ncbi:hypothetical protein P280DRAFT_488969 [Massarina eburnea CBS 473.64]|uniref:Zn(2)-C6 fungal-type domain-containing protein n=1 Tax=Massarina eburnea CBS 473.64 TaxID=1395130 RepID=A0A6A6S8I4_9PLEO|nr:hypothetical protein P280DRAFT_488969 [Massarina eburnea CBS 473.64]